MEMSDIHQQILHTTVFVSLRSWTLGLCLCVFVSSHKTLLLLLLSLLLLLLVVALVLSVGHERRWTRRSSDIASTCGQGPTWTGCLLLLSSSWLLLITASELISTLRSKWCVDIHREIDAHHLSALVLSLSLSPSHTILYLITCWLLLNLLATKYKTKATLNIGRRYYHCHPNWW